MSAVTELELATGPRWSSAVVCTRKAILEGRGVERDPVDERLERLFRRGKAWERVITDEIVGQLRAAGQRPRVQDRVAWPAIRPVGIGHPDIWIPASRTIVEVHSNPGGLLQPHKALQAAGYGLVKRARRVVVLAVDSHTGDDHEYEIDHESLAPSVLERMRTVARGVEDHDAPLPDRINQHPFAFPCESCQVRTACWDGWEAPAIDELFGADHLGHDLATREDEVAVRRAELAAAEAERDVARLRVAALVPPGDPVLLGGVRVKRTSVAGRRSFDLRGVEAAGHRLPKRLAAFVKVGEPSERWTVRRVG